MLHPLPFKLYVVLLVHSAGTGECWPSLNNLAASMNGQIGAVKRGCEILIEANLLELRQGTDGLDHYFVKRPGEELRRRKRSREREHTQKIADQRAVKHNEDELNKAEDRKDASTRNLAERIRVRPKSDKGSDSRTPPPQRPERYS